VNVTDDPEAQGLVPEVNVMVAEGATDGFTVMVIVLDAAVVVVTHAKFEIMVQVTV
jgi:hypothetical protein